MNKREIEKIYKMSQMELKIYLTNYLEKKYDNVVSNDGFVYAQGTFPVMLVAHMDTVHRELVKEIIYAENKNIISSPQGIGGDDRNGIIAIIEIIKKFPCSVLFCEDEEIGAVGANKFVETKLAQTLNFNYIIEFDRKGSNDAVFYDCNNPDFEEFITKDFFKTAQGSFTDISILAPFFGCAAVNLSCGYYNAHTKDEYVVIPEMLTVIEEACAILERTTENDTFKYIESKGGWDHDYSEGYYIIEYEDERGDTQWFDTDAFSMEEAVGKFCIETLLPYTNIIDISDETYYTM